MGVCSSMMTSSEEALVRTCWTQVKQKAFPGIASAMLQSRSPEATENRKRLGQFLKDQEAFLGRWKPQHSNRRNTGLVSEVQARIGVGKVADHAGLEMST